MGFGAEMEWEWHLGWTGRRWEYDIKTGVKTRSNTYSSRFCRCLVNTVMDCRFPNSAGNFLTKRGNISFWRKSAACSQFVSFSLLTAFLIVHSKLTADVIWSVVTSCVCVIVTMLTAVLYYLSIIIHIMQPALRSRRSAVSPHRTHDIKHPVPPVLISMFHLCTNVAQKWN
jgi:hypothetical protein